MQTKETAGQKLAHAYTKMLERIKHAAVLEKAIESARKTAVELGELTQDEAEKVSMYLKRDLEDAGKYLAATGKELADWLAFDWRLIEERTWETFSAAADKTTLEWLALQQQLQLGPEYRTGEVTGIGTLCCVNCTEAIHFRQAAHIPPCPKCHHTAFIRAK